MSSLVSPVTAFALRLLPHQDLKAEILNFATKNNLRAGCILSCVGSLEQVHLRYANQTEGNLTKGYFEILSLSGTVSKTAVHLHLAAADHKGLVRGGHLLDNNLVYTTVELVIGELPSLTFERIVDPAYGYKELFVHRRKRAKR